MFVRDEIPKEIRNMLGNDVRYVVEGSVGKGNWARVPRLAVFDRLITNTARRGFYIVYLVCEDCSGVYLSINQGVTTVQEAYGTEAKHALRIRACDFLAQLGSIDKAFSTEPLNLKVTSSTDLGAFYQAGTVCSKFYPAGSLPDDEVLRRDLLQIIDLYLLLSSKAILSQGSTPPEADESGLGIEDLSLLREHKRIERNQKLASDAKRLLGHICLICGFNFEEHYKEIGRGFIEAHHLVPLAELRGRKVQLEARKDFAVLCSNCHRMIHRSNFVSDIEAFREAHLKDRA